ncbi:MAG: 4-alpha-glucanotransferase [Clostridiaceae bacterium]|nr:4-alpha-glucanotransferase [Clostridiaceae bacterium]
MRSSGILLPVSSLPSPHGIGSLGQAACRFIDFLQAAGQQFWQILPIGPTGYGDSPYQSFSAFAANPYFIDLDLLTEQGLLKTAEVESITWGSAPDQVDYGTLYQNRLAILRLAAGRLDPAAGGFPEYAAAEAEWLDDYALFMALKNRFNMASLRDWPLPARTRDEAVLLRLRGDMADEILFWKQIQYLFSRQWQALKAYAHQKGIRIIGDIPIYVSPDSSDLWAHPELFQVDDQLDLTEVAGCPPDPFAPEGQLWGNPLYNWPRHRDDHYRWWIKRLRQAGQVYDVVRIDHFRGFESYYAIPGRQETAAGGRWRQGPGLSFIEAIKQNLPELPIIAEDLGFITPEVRQLLAESGYPGMKVLQFAFDSREPGDYKPFTYQRNSVVYTGTHDNTTTEDWQHSAPADSVQIAREFMDVDRPEDFTWRFIRTALASVSDICIIPLQDYLRLGAQARINTPSTKTGNWQWRVDAAVLTEDLAAKIYRLTGLYGRLA